MRPLGILLAAAIVVTTAAPARADVTAFLGANTTPANRVGTGVAVGLGLLVVGLEFEYSSSREDPAADAPALRTGMGNVLLQTPGAIFGFQPYLTIGAGLYRETMGGTSDTGFGLNTGGGVKIALAGPLRLRLDYRVFTLGDDARATPAHRVYAGLNLGF
jgi:opacity protein-like surface antigen